MKDSEEILIIEDKTEYKKDQPISFLNTPRALFANQILQEETSGRIRVLNPLEVVQYWDSIPERSSTHADTNSVPIYPNDGVNEDLRLKALGIIGKDPNKLESPLLILNLGVEPSDSSHGFTFTETPYSETIEAPFLRKDQRVEYDSKTKTLVPTDDNTRDYIWTPSDQSGLLMACRSSGGGVNFRDDDLLDSNWVGRIQIIQDPQCLAGNLDELVNQLETERKNQIAEVNVRYNKALQTALDILRTG